MRIAMVGLGRMGGDLTRRLIAGGHEVVVNDLDPELVAGLTAEGAIGAGSLAEVAELLDGPRVVWIMVPAGATGLVVDAVADVRGVDLEHAPLLLLDVPALSLQRRNHFERLRATVADVSPRQGRHFFEQVIRDNLGLGRPDRVSLLFPTRHTRRTPPPKAGYRTRVITQGVNPTLHVEYKSSHVKQYFKEERALRTETTINNPYDVRVNKGLKNFDALRDIGRAVNAKLLETERVSQDCALSQEELDSS